MSDYILGCSLSVNLCFVIYYLFNMLGICFFCFYHSTRFKRSEHKQLVREHGSEFRNGVVRRHVGIQLCHVIAELQGFMIVKMMCFVKEVFFIATVPKQIVEELRASAELARQQVGPANAVHAEVVAPLFRVTIMGAPPSYVLSTMESDCLVTVQFVDSFQPLPAR